MRERISREEGDKNSVQLANIRGLTRIDSLTQLWASCARVNKLAPIVSCRK